MGVEFEKVREKRSFRREMKELDRKPKGAERKLTEEESALVDEQMEIDRKWFQEHPNSFAFYRPPTAADRIQQPIPEDANGSILVIRSLYDIGVRVRLYDGNVKVAFPRESGWNYGVAKGFWDKANAARPAV